MALDAGEISANQGAPDLAHLVVADHLAGLRPVRVVLDSSGHVGAALKTARESLGVSEDDIAQATRIRAAYIAAIEAFDFDALPARPFVVGYVRAYARALGLEAESVVARFQREAPKVDGKLRPPGGVNTDAFASMRWLVVVGVMVISAVAIWNLTRRVELQTPLPDEAATWRSAPARPPIGPARIGAPLPTPPEATTPPVYQTPGLAGVATPTAPSHPSSPVNGKTASLVAQPGDGGAPATFAPGGSIYGEGGTPTSVVLQARKPTTLIVRAPGGGISFARLLAPGEAWRSSGPGGQVADVADPAAIEVYVGGVSRGRLVKAQTVVADLRGP
jgi:hypothetical protein